MKHLFTPFQLKNHTLRNRIVMPGVASFLINNDGTVTEKTVEHYRLKAAGGAAMVIMEACAVSPEGIVSPHQARIYDDRFTGELSRIADTMKKEGAVPALQIHHGGRQTSPRVIKRKPLAPSPLPCPTIRGDVEALDKESIQRLVSDFGRAAERTVAAGFELLEIHGAHGYLINQFLSAFSNIREDEYGSDIIGRTRFPREIIREIRKRIGPEFPVSFKISAQEFVKDGLDVEESIAILKLLVPEGIDIVQVSAGNDATPEWICQPMFMQKACLVSSAQKIKQALDVPVMAVGRINDPVIADQIIAQAKADLVCIGRGLLADPELPKKAKQGRLDDIRTCIACNTCMESIFRKGRVECTVNPMLGREKEMAFHPAREPKKVMVIGGGPGGLNVAWVGARRGHDVHLYEKESFLGGKLIIGSVTGYKKELLNLVRFQKRQVEKFDVKCHLNHTATMDTVKTENPEVVILATGSLPLFPSIPGIDKPIVVPFTEILSTEQQLSGKPTVVVVGGGPTGCEVALHLAQNGCSVNIVEMLPKIGNGLESITRKLLLRELESHQVRMLPATKISKVEDNGVMVIGPDQQEYLIESQKVVIAIGNRPDNDLYEQIKSQGYEIHQIGDCLEPRSAKAAVYEGAVLGRAI